MLLTRDKAERRSGEGEMNIAFLTPERSTVVCRRGRSEASRSESKRDTRSCCTSQFSHSTLLLVSHRSRQLARALFLFLPLPFLLPSVWNQESCRVDVRARCRTVERLSEKLGAPSKCRELADRGTKAPLLFLSLKEIVSVLRLHGTGDMLAG